MNDTPTPRTDAESYDPPNSADGWKSLNKHGDCVDSEFARQLETELAAVTEQRDQYKAALQSADNHNHEIATKLEIVTEQRDRLAEALNRISEYQGVDDEDPKTMAIEALQSLNQPTQ